MPSFSCLTQLPLLKYNYHAARSYTVPRTWRCSEAQHRIRVSRASNLTKRFEYKYGTSRAGRGEACKEGTPPPESELKKNKKNAILELAAGRSNTLCPLQRCSSKAAMQGGARPLVFGIEAVTFVHLKGCCTSMSSSQLNSIFPSHHAPLEIQLLHETVHPHPLYDAM